MAVQVSYEAARGDSIGWPHFQPSSEEMETHDFDFYESFSRARPPALRASARILEIKKTLNLPENSCLLLREQF
ncbi:MAG TPA: hypothetical protein DCE44_13185 [Verrucomicrobiales bacterium]|nr:hypothetical protein [Verrucomicrobiales bacterium]